MFPDLALLLDPVVRLSLVYNLLAHLLPTQSLLFLILGKFAEVIVELETSLIPEYGANPTGQLLTSYSEVSPLQSNSYH
jgi:hypothetical protein